MSVMDTKIRDFFSVNLSTIPLKIACFLAGGVIGSHVAFLNVFFVSTGLSKFKAGIITGLTYAPPIVAGPVWGYLADFSGRRKLILTVLCLGAVLPLFSTPWVARAIYPQSKFECGNSNGTRVLHAEINGTDGSELSDMSYLSLYGSRAECERLRDEAVDTLFWVLLAIMLVESVFLVPLQPHVEAIVMGVVKSGSPETSYGAQRIFGCIGLSLANFCAGKAIAHYKVKDISPFSAAFFLLIPCALLLIPVAWYLLNRLKDGLKARRDEEDGENEKEGLQCEDRIEEKSHFNQIVQLCVNMDVVLFLLTVLIVGLANSVSLNFSFLYVTEIMQVNKSEMTYVIVTSTLSEAIMFPFTAKTIKLLRGTMPSIIVGCMAHFVRFLVMSYDIPFGVFVGLQTLSSLGFALAFAAMMEHCHVITPEPIRVTMNTIMTTLFFIVSAFVANIVGAKIYEMYGGKVLFFGQSLLCGVWSFVILCHYFSKQWRRSNSSRDTEPASSNSVKS